MSESSDITNPLIKMLNQTGGLALRMNSGTIRVGKRYIKLQEEGTADILFFPRPRLDPYRDTSPVWIETKAPHGKTAKSRVEAQARFRQKVEDLGHRYVFAVSVWEGFDLATQ